MPIEDVYAKKALWRSAGMYCRQEFILSRDITRDDTEGKEGTRQSG